MPLLERLRFLSISATNLDEFYTVRVAGLRELARSGKGQPSDDGLMPAEQLVRINQDARALMQTQQRTLRTLRRAMEAEGIAILGAAKLSRRDRAFLQAHFVAQVFPVLSPLAIDPAHPFPFIPNGGFCLGLDLARTEGGRTLTALRPIPQQVARFALAHRPALSGL